MSDVQTEHGPWSSRAFARLLTRVVKDRKLAYLVVSDGRSEKCLFYTHGGLRITCVGERQAIDIVGAIRRHPKFQKGWLPEGEVDPDRLEKACAANFELERVTHDAYKLVARHELFDLMVWDGAEFTFAPGDPPRQVFDRRLQAVRLSTGVNKVLEEVLDRVDDWKELKRNLGSPAKTRFSRGPTTAGEADRLTQTLLNTIKANGGDCRFERLLIAGRRTSNLHALRVAERVRELVRQKVLETYSPVSGEGLTSKLQQEVASEIDGIEKALELMINHLQARRRLAQGYQALGDNGAAVDNLRAVGEAYLERGDPEQAIGVFREVLGIVPEAFFAREQIANVYENLKRVPEAVGEWLGLAQSYASFGLLNRALARMLNVVRLEPTNTGHRRRLIDLREAMGDAEGAARDYAALGELYQAQGELQKAGACLARSMELAPEEAEFKSKARELRPATGGGGKVFAVLAWLLVVVGAVGAWGHRSARAAFVEARQSAADAAVAGDFEAAYTSYADYAALYGWQHALVRRAHEDAIARRDLAQASDEREAVTRIVEALPRWDPRLRSQLNAYVEQESEAKRLVRKAAGHAERGERGQLLEVARQLASPELAWTPEAKAFRFAVELKSLPAGAQLSREGVSLGSCPKTFELGVEPVELTVTHSRFAPSTLRLDLADEELNPTQVVQLAPEQRWSSAALGPYTQRPAVGRGRVVVCGSDQRVRAFGAEGEEVWTFRLAPGEQPVAAPVLARGGVVVATDQRLRVLEVDTGVERWSQQNPPGGVQLLGAYGDQVVLLRGKSVRSLSAKTREVLWESTPTGGALAGGRVRGGYALLTTKAGEAVALALRTHEVVKTLKLPSLGTATPLLTEHGFVVFGEDKRLRLIHNEERWAVGLRHPLAAPLIYTPGDTPLVWTADGSSVACMELERGRARWSRDFEHPITDLVVGSRVFVATADGAVWCLATADGAPRWKFQAGGEARLVATGEALYVADAAGGLVALPID